MNTFSGWMLVLGSIGLLACSTDTEQLCGNGELDPGEQCDGTKLKGQSCQSLGFGEGDLACDEYCMLDRSDCKEAEVPPNPALKYCVLEGLCASAEYPWIGLGFCVQQQTIFGDLLSGIQTTSIQASLPARSCQYEADNCIQWWACLEANEAQAAGCEEGTLFFCDGDWLVTCYGDRIQATDCSASGLVCVELESGSASCAISECDPDVTEPSCAGDTIVECNGGWLLASDCGELKGDVTCDDSSGQPTCIGLGEACGPEFVAHCEGSVMVRCEGGHLAHLDCKSLSEQATCRMQGDFPNCEPEASACEPTAYQESCAEGIITFCNMGRVDTLNCKDYGGAACSVGDFVGRAVARCVP